MATQSRRASAEVRAEIRLLGGSRTLSETSQESSEEKQDVEHEEPQLIRQPHRISAQLYGNTNLRLQNDSFLRAAKRLPTDYVPVWVMRQGLSSFLELCRGRSFWEVCCTPEIASDCTVAPVKRYGVDAAIIFTDILAPLQAFGCRLVSDPKYGMRLSSCIKKPSAVDQLTFNDVQSSIISVIETIQLSKMKLRGQVPLVGSIGAPFTLFCYLLESHVSQDLRRVKRWMQLYPISCSILLQKITLLITEVALMQIENGAQALQVNDFLLGQCPAQFHDEFAYLYLRQLALKIRKTFPHVPLILQTFNTGHCLPGIIQCGYDVVSVDYKVDPAYACQVSNGSVSLQGNLDPAVLSADHATISREVSRMLLGFGVIGTIANLGGGLDPETEPQSIIAFVDAVHGFQETKSHEICSPVHSPTLYRAYSALDSSAAQRISEQFIRPGYFSDTSAQWMRSPTSPLLASDDHDLNTSILLGLLRSFRKLEWVPDHQVLSCTLCDKRFGLFTRKHHCRKCGQIFCHDCSTRRFLLTQTGSAVRVCDRCYSTLTFHL
eukprot:TRINITY_DN8463_c0_g1_i1.p1 TRINITY_DN8463_c0_g1~~TRINITY_DN8463_c0_g1_i1.p1  ORF type:complete len:549 (+),score=86.37 TRINITY_DN8463_c0_g1_i1:60-1706(+)